MVNHTNGWGNKRPSRNPDPAEIKTARDALKLTQEQASAIVHSTRRVWYQWENGLRKMHPAFWELFLIKTSKKDN